MKKIITFCLCLCFVCFSCGAYAAEHQQKAEALYALGLFRGTDKGYELESPLTRVQAAAMLVRVLGAEEEALENAKSSIFHDVPDEHWGAPYVMYCFEENITKGTSSDSFTPDRRISAEEFTTLILRLMGFEAEPETAFEKAIDYRLFGTEKSRQMSDVGEFLRDDMVFVVFRALQTPCADGKTLSEKLVDAGVIQETVAEQYGAVNPHRNDDINSIIDALLN